MNAHDTRTLEERLRWIADWSEPDIDLADAGTAREALERIEQLTAEVERLKAIVAELNDSDVIARTMAENERKDAEIAWLRDAGTKLAGFAAHGIDCEDLTGAYPGSCSCGYASAWKAWIAALEGKQG